MEENEQPKFSFQHCGSQTHDSIKLCISFSLNDIIRWRPFCFCWQAIYHSPLNSVTDCTFLSVLEPASQWPVCLLPASFPEPARYPPTCPSSWLCMKPKPQQPQDPSLQGKLQYFCYTAKCHEDCVAQCSGNSAAKYSRHSLNSERSWLISLFVPASGVLADALPISVLVVLANVLPVPGSEVLVDPHLVPVSVAVCIKGTGWCSSHPCNKCTIWCSLCS